MRAFHQIRHLAHSHEVYLFCLTEPGTQEDPRDLSELTSITQAIKLHPIKRWRRWLRMAFAPFSTRPFQVHWFYQRPAHRALNQWMEDIQPDVVLCQLVRMASYVQHAHHVPRVLDYMDALSAGMARQSRLARPTMRWIYRIEYRRLKAYESTVFDYFDGKTIISQADKRLIGHPEHQDITVVPNGIDTAFFKSTQPNATDDKPVILFTGNMSYPPNVDAACQLVNEVLPLLASNSIRVVIAGTNPTPEVKALATERVEVTGWIPDIRDAYARAALFVAPLRIGTGQQNKILEAMSMNLPCVTTQHVASGFPSATGETAPLRIANSAKGIAAEVDALLMDQEARIELGSLSRQWVEKHCDWDASARLMEDTFVHSMSNETP